MTSKNTFFSRMALRTIKSHSIARTCHPFTAFEVNGQLFEFTRYPFGISNTLAACQRKRTSSVHRHNMKQTHPYLDNVTIRGRSEEDCQETMRNFVKPAVRLQMLGYVADLNAQNWDGIPYPRKHFPVESPAWVFCVQRKMGCRRLKLGCSYPGSTKTTGLSAQLSFSTGYSNSQEGRFFCRTRASPLQTNLSFSKPTRPEAVSVRHSIRATNVSFFLENS